jgi:deoxyadenosine/deoxycytidine kinase
MKKIIYSIEGNIGSGKSTLLSLIAKKSENVCIIKEPVDEWQKVG